MVMSSGHQQQSRSYSWERPVAVRLPVHPPVVAFSTHLATPRAISTHTRCRQGIRMFEEWVADVKLTLVGSPKRSTPEDARGGVAAGSQAPPSGGGGDADFKQDLSKLKRPGA